MTTHGDLEVVVNKVPYGDVFGAETDKNTMTVKEYINTYMTDEYVYFDQTRRHVALR